MSLAATFARYVGQRFLTAVLAMLAALTLLVSLFDFIELLRRAATRADAGFALVAEIAALRLPFIALQILPFGLLLGGILAFWRLARSSELIAARAAGISAWATLAGPFLVALGLGVGATVGLSPLSSALLARAERLDLAYLRSGGGVGAIAGGRLWLRQGDTGLEAGGVAILSGRPAGPANQRDIAPRPDRFTLTEISLWRLSAADRPLERIEAPRAGLEPGQWVFEDATIFAPDRPGMPTARLVLPTDLTRERIETSFASPDTLSVWALPGFIAVLETAGFSAIRHRLHFQSLLALPVLSVAMALLAAGFATRPARRGGVAQMIAGGVAAGFALFVLDRVTGEFGEVGSIPVGLAAWAPSVVGMCCAVALLLHLEEG